MTHNVQTTVLLPFWRYYGGKYRAGLLYPKPKFSRIIEPFAGAAGYSLRYPDADVLLVDKYPVIVGIWDYLIRVSAWELLRIPTVYDVRDLPDWVPQEARWYIGFRMGYGMAYPKLRMSKIMLQEALKSETSAEGWNPAMRERVAWQVQHIRHWRVRLGSYADIANERATWHIDPPYWNAGRCYIMRLTAEDYQHLAAWCRTRMGQVMVCENVGARWLPFKPFITIQGMRAGNSREALWYRDNAHPDGPPAVDRGKRAA